MDVAALGGHRSRGDPADLGVVASGGDEEQDRSGRRAGPEHRSDDRDVGEMGAAVIRIVDGVHVARLDRPAPAPHDLLHARAHRAEMDGDVGGVGDQVAGGIEHRAREVEPFTDVHRLRGRLQRRAHLLGGRHEEVVEDLQHHGVRVRPDPALRPGLHPLDQQVPRRRHRRLPPLIHDGGRVGLGDDRRTGHRGSGPHPLALEQRRRAPLPCRPEPHGLRVDRRPGPGADRDLADIGEVGLLRQPRRLHRDRLHDEPALEQEGVRPPVDRLERRHHVVRIGQLDRQARCRSRRSADGHGWRPASTAPARPRPRARCRRRWRAPRRPRAPDPSSAGRAAPRRIALA